MEFDGFAIEQFERMHGVRRKTKPQVLRQVIVAFGNVQLIARRVFFAQLVDTL